jgi:hypothetical protein
MAFGFDLEAVMEGYPIVHKRGQLRYQDIYNKVEKYIRDRNDSWMIFDGIERYAEASSIKCGIRRKFKQTNFEISIRKHNRTFTVSVRVAGRKVN